ncbi:MAG TPA: hypothetical protein ENO23_02995 [Alphaproteobacteria bacterium]|nr:hypothetical protein [Alphaproteobacteria bacterium]
MTEDLLLPPIDEENAPFWEGARRGELLVQRCADTGRLLFPPRLRSPFGARRTPDWVAVSGRGTIWSFVIPHPPLLPAYASVAPYNVVLVALEEDPRVRMVGNLVPAAGASIGEIDGATIEIGEPVRVVFEPVTDEIHMPRWVRAGGGADE